MKGKLIDLTGQRFGRWTVLERAPSGLSGPMWKCRCDCGTERAAVAGSALTGGATKSCGCGRGGKPKIVVDETIDPADALTTDADLRVRQLSLVLYSARAAAENAGAVYASAIRKMRAAEIQLTRAVNERRSAQ